MLVLADLSLERCMFHVKHTLHTVSGIKSNAIHVLNVEKKFTVVTEKP
jgi:hypothetical protein